VIAILLRATWMRSTMHPAINGIVTTEAFASQHKEVLDKLVSLWFRTVNFMEKDLKQNSTNILTYLSKVASTRYTPDEYVVAWTFDVFPHDAKEADKLFNDPSSSAYWKTTWDANNEFLLQQGKTKTPVPYSAYWGETNLNRLSKD
jgi:ABC-type nitrate/sulfonate/bicarbonate transport system substrate-binding protein